MSDSFQRYLRAKRPVDDRALDRRLIGDLRTALSARAAERDGPLRILELGAGIGTMLTRLVAWDVLPAGECQYTAVDIDADNVAEIPRHLRSWATGRPQSVTGTDPLILQGPDRTIEVDAVPADAVAFADGTDAKYDLLVGAALLDILERDALEPFLSAVAPGGRYYFPITFDGATRFRPRHPADETVERRYHAHMDGKPGGSSQAGGDVLARLQNMAGLTDRRVAGSDWIVRPTGDGYPGDEAYFLRYILDTIESAVREVGGVDGLDDWLARRREQVETGELLYHTHQLDFLGRVADPDAVER